MRDRPVPCRGASLQESIRGTHKTWADDAYCDRCRVLHAESVARVRAAQVSPIDLSAPGGADRTALPTSSREERVWVPQVPSSASPPACSPVVVPEVCMASRGDGTFDDGFLSPSPGEQVRSGGNRPSLPEPVTAGPARRLLAESSPSPADMSGTRRLGHTH